MSAAIEAFTATVYRKFPLFSRPAHKRIIIESLQFLVNDKRIQLYGFTILPTCIHILWERQGIWQQRNVRQIFMKYTAQQLKYYMRCRTPHVLEKYKSDRPDRLYQFWERGKMKRGMSSVSAIEGFLCAIHAQPRTDGLCVQEQDYRHSSASFYVNGQDRWQMLTNIYENE